MNRIFYVDLENVGSNGLDGIQELNAYDEIIVFLSDRVKRINMDFLDNGLETYCNVRFVYTRGNDRNALDSHISLYLGMLSKKSKLDVNHIVVSNDKGYDSVISFLTEKKVKAKRIGSVREYIERRNKR